MKIAHEGVQRPEFVENVRMFQPVKMGGVLEQGVCQNLTAGKKNDQGFEKIRVFSQEGVQIIFIKNLVREAF